jgi:hypothetical protein
MREEGFQFLGQGVLLHNPTEIFETVREGASIDFAHYTGAHPTSANAQEKFEAISLRFPGLVWLFCMRMSETNNL